MVDVRRPASVHCVADGGGFHQIVFWIHYRLRAPDEQDGIAVVRSAYFIVCEQFHVIVVCDGLALKGASRTAVDIRIDFEVLHVAGAV